MSLPELSESERTELERLREECCTCEKCGHIQAEPNWCHLCRHRVSFPHWATELMGERQAAMDANDRAEEFIREIDRLSARYWEGDDVA